MALLLFSAAIGDGGYSSCSFTRIGEGHDRGGVEIRGGDPAAASRADPASRESRRSVAGAAVEPGAGLWGAPPTTSGMVLVEKLAFAGSSRSGENAKKTVVSHFESGQSKSGSSSS
jgi:hypothetical protein